MKYRSISLVFGMLGALLSAAHCARAQPYPGKPIRILVGYAQGSQGDVALRLVSMEMAKRLGQAVVVENRPGASTTLGASATIKAPADGYTAYFGGTSSHGVFVKNNAVDASRELSPVTALAQGQYFLFVRSSLPIRSVADLVAHAKANPNRLNFGTSALVLNVMMQALQQQQPGLTYTVIPYKGSNQTTAAMLAGEADVTVGSAGPLFIPNLQSGAFRVLMSFTNRHSTLIAESPSAGELGMPNLDFAYTLGLWLPLGTPQEVGRKLAQEAVAVVKLPEIADQFRKNLGFEPLGSTPEEQLRIFASEIRNWTDAARLANYQPQ